MSSDATGVVDLAADADVAFRIATKIYAGLAASQVMENCGDRYLSKSLLILLAKNLTKYFGIKFNIPVGNSHVKTLYDALSNIYDNLDPAFYRMVAKWLANLLYSHNMVQDVATVLRTAFECVVSTQPTYYFYLYR